MIALDRIYPGHPVEVRPRRPPLIHEASVRLDLIADSRHVLHAFDELRRAVSDRVFPPLADAEVFEALERARIGRTPFDSDLLGPTRFLGISTKVPEIGAAKEVRAGVIDPAATTTYDAAATWWDASNYTVTTPLTLQAQASGTTIKYTVNGVSVGNATAFDTTVIDDWATSNWGSWYHGAPANRKAQKRKKGFELLIENGLAQIPRATRRYGLPNGAVLHVDESKIRVDDRKAKVLYRAAYERPFNPYINASDMLTEFVRYVGGLGVRRHEVLRLPVGLFVNWLVVEAAEKDQERPPSELKPLPEQIASVRTALRPNRCVCGKFVRRAFIDAGFRYCGPRCAERHYDRLTAPRALAA